MPTQTSIEPTPEAIPHRASAKSSFGFALFTKTRLRRNLTLITLGGLMGWLHAPYNAWWITFFAFPALLHILAPLKPGAAWRTTWLFSFAYFTTGLYWIANALFLDLASYWWAIPLAVTGLPLILALFHACAGWATQHWLATASPYSRAIAFSVFWSIAEYARGHLFTGFPWLMIGQLWIDVDWARQLAALGGAYLLSFWAVLIACLPYAIISTRASESPWAQQTRQSAVLLLVLLATAYAYGYQHMRTPPLATDTPPFTIRLVQPNIPQTLKINTNTRAEMLKKTLDAATSAPLEHIQVGEQTGEEARPDQPQKGNLIPDLVIFPESAIPYRIDNDHQLRQTITSHAPFQSIVLTGAIRKDTTGSYYNSMVAINHNGEMIATYDKNHLVPFGSSILPMTAGMATHTAPINTSQ